MLSSKLFSFHDYSEIIPLIESYFSTVSTNNQINSKKEMINFFLAKGMQHKIANSFVNEMLSLWNIENSTLADKRWSMQKGFFPSRKVEYGLTETNCYNYMPDFDYYMLHPINNHFAIWINDKLTLKYILDKQIARQGGGKLKIMPDYYLYVENNGNYTYLMDLPKDVKKDKNFIFNLLQNKKELAIKPSNGAGGKGFNHLMLKGNNIYLNKNKINKKQFHDFISELKGCIITEYIKQHSFLDSVWDGSVCTLRIITAKLQHDAQLEPKFIILSSYARFGTKASNGVSNLHQGGVGINYDFETGLFDSKFWYDTTYHYKGSQFLKCHPDSGISLAGKYLPNWQMVKKVVLEVCKYLSSIDFMGFDIMISENDIIICEINSLPAIDGPAQKHNPWGLSSDSSLFFNKKLEKFNILNSTFI